MYIFKRTTILLLMLLVGGRYASAEEDERKPIIELSSNCKTFYPDKMGISPNQSLLALLQTIPGLMSTTDTELSEKISLSVDNEAHIFDVCAVLRRIRVMDVERVEIVNTPDANSGTVGLGVSVSVILKKNAEGFHGNVALDCNTNRTIDPTMNFSWRKGNWSIRGGASLYFDRSKTETLTETIEKRDSGEVKTSKDEIEKEDTYGENAYLKARYRFSKSDFLSLSFSQEHLKVKSETDHEEVDKQNSNSVRLGYNHKFSEKAAFKLSTTAKYQNNPHLYGYQNYNIYSGTTTHSNTSSNTQHYFVEVTQTLPLWKDASLQLGEKLDFGIMNELSEIRIDSTGTYYDVNANNSQTMAQIDWHIGKWQFQAGEVIDYFHYKIGFTSLPDKDNKTTSPQTYFSVGFRINPQHIVHASYRTSLKRPNYKQIYPITTAMDVNNNYALQDSLFNALNNSTAHTFNVGHVYNHNTISVSTNFKTIIVKDLLTSVDHVWRNSAENNYIRLYSSLVWTPGNFSTALTVAVNQLYYKKTKLDSFERNTGFDVRWMGIYNFKHDWNVGASIDYNGPVWYPYGKMGDYVYANVHVTKSIGRWSFNACMNDIFDMSIKTYKNTETKREKSTEERDYRGLSVGVSYKF